MVNNLVHEVDEWERGVADSSTNSLKWALVNEGSSDVIYLDAESPVAALLESLEKLGWGLYLSTDAD